MALPYQKAHDIAPIETVLDRLDGVKQQGDGYIARCPAHDDRKPSLSVSTGDDGKVLLKCFAGCETGAIVAAIGMEMHQLFPAEKGPVLRAVKNQPRRIVATYDYTDAAGDLIAQVVRYEPKDFRQRRPDGKGGWLWKTSDLQIPLYNLPGILGSDDIVFVCEGEKDADRLIALGLTATTHPGGAGKWRPWHTAMLAGRDVAIVPDNDAAGRKHALEVAADLHAAECTVRVLDLCQVLPLPDKGDVCDLIDAFGDFTADDLLDFAITDTPIWTPETPTLEAVPPGPALISAADLMRKVFPEPRWAVPDVIPEGLTILAGAPKLGKSWLALNIGAAIALGGRAIGKIPVQGGDVLYLALEDTPRRLQDRLRRTLPDGSLPERLAIATSWPTLADGGAAHIAGWLANHPDARLVIIDTFQKLRGPVATNTNQYAADYEAAGEFKRLADLYGVAFVVVHHTRKATADDPLDMVSGTQGLSGAADSTCILRKQPGKADAAMYIRGRDVPEADHALTFDAVTCTWTMLGDAGEYRLSEERREILDILRAADEPLPPRRIAEALNKKDGAVRKLLYTMVKAGEVDNIGGAYRMPLSPGNSGNAGNTMAGGVSGGNSGDGVTGVTTHTTVTGVTGVTGTQRELIS